MSTENTQTLEEWSTKDAGDIGERDIYCAGKIVANNVPTFIAQYICDRHNTALRTALTNKDEELAAMTRSYQKACESEEILRTENVRFAQLIQAASITKQELRAALAKQGEAIEALTRALGKWQAWTHLVGIDKYPKDCREITDSVLRAVRAVQPAAQDQKEGE